MYPGADPRCRRDARGRRATTGMPAYRAGTSQPEGVAHVLWERIIEVLADDDAPLVHAKCPLAGGRRLDQRRHLPATPGDDDLLAVGHILEQPGQVCLRLMN